MACNFTEGVASLACCVSDREACRSGNVSMAYYGFEGLVTAANLYQSAHTMETITGAPTGSATRTVFQSRSTPCLSTPDTSTDDLSTAYTDAVSHGTWGTAVVVELTDSLRETRRVNSVSGAIWTIVQTLSGLLTAAEMIATARFHAEAIGLDDRPWGYVGQRTLGSPFGFPTENAPCVWSAGDTIGSGLSAGGRCSFAAGGRVSKLSGFPRWNVFYHIQDILSFERWCVVEYTDETRTTVGACSFAGPGDILRFRGVYVARFLCGFGPTCCTLLCNPLP